MQQKVSAVIEPMTAGHQHPSVCICYRSIGSMAVMDTAQKSFSSQGTKAKCLAVSQIKGLLLPPRKRWNNKHGRHRNQPYLLLAPDSHICAAPLSVSHTAAAEAGEASAQCLAAPIACESPGKQLTGTQTANQMMDPTRRIRHDRGR